MTADHQAHRGRGWDVMHRTLAADAVVAEALLCVSATKGSAERRSTPDDSAA